MLTLKHRDWGALRARQRERFVADTVAVVRRESPDYFHGIDDQQAAARIDAGVAQAQALSLRSGRHVRAFVAMQCVAGEGFLDDKRYELVARTLANRRVDADTRVRRAGEALLSLVE